MEVPTDGVLLGATWWRLLPTPVGGDTVGLRDPRVVTAHVRDRGLAPAAQLVPMILIRPRLVHQTVCICMVGWVVAVAYLCLPVRHVG